MVAPALATSNPPRLLNSVGPQGRNEPADVTLTQALLRGRKGRNGRAFLAARVQPGRFDPATAEALARFLDDQRPGPPARAGQPPSLPARQHTLRAGSADSDFALLARGQSLAVLKGTATPYDYQHRAAPGRICGPLADQLPSGRRPALERLLRELSADYGICFDATVKSAPDGSRALVAELRPRPARQWSREAVPLTRSDSRPPHPQARPVYQAIADDLSQRAAQAFRTSDPAAQAANRQLKGQLALIISDKLMTAEDQAQTVLFATGRLQNKLAEQFWAHYLGASGEAFLLSRDEALAFQPVANAVAENNQRFLEQSLLAPKPLDTEEALTQIPRNSCPADPRRLPEGRGRLVSERMRIMMEKSKGGEAQILKDHWKVDIDESVFKGIERYLGQPYPDGLLLEADERASLFIATGSSHVTSCGTFSLRRFGNNVLVTGRISHVWTDEGFNFNEGAYFSSEARILERAGKAAPFQWWASWDETVEGELAIVGGALRARHIKLSSAP